MAANRLLCSLTLISACALAMLGLAADIATLLVALALVGFAYGAVIAVFPPVIAGLVGMEAYPRVYGRVFTAWGCAGLLAPLVAGYAFDLSGGYGMALALAFALALIAALFNLTLPRSSSGRWLASRNE
jgi:MFS family permease